MAERTNGEFQLDSGIALMETKIPNKNKKSKKMSLFKKSQHDESGSRLSGRAKKKGGSKDKKFDSTEALETAAEAQQNFPEISTTSPVQSHPPLGLDNHQYDIQVQEQEQKNTGDLSLKQFQKLNRELAKQRKSVDALKKDKEVLESEKVKLRSENKSLERVLKKSGDHHRLSKKHSQLSMDEYAPSMDELKVKELQDILADRDYKITQLTLKIEKMHPDHFNGSDGIEMEGGPSGIRTTNGTVLDFTATLEKLLEEQDNSLKLRKENAELRSCILSMEAELDKLQRDSDPSPRTPRKRSSGFFKRGKKSTSSMPSRNQSIETGSQDLLSGLRSQSPVMGASESHHELDVSSSPLLSRINKESTVSLPCYASPNLSPQMSAKVRANSDIITLQACLKLALSEKSLSEENASRLYKELDDASEKIHELEGALETKTSKEVEKVKKSLMIAEMDRDAAQNKLKSIKQEMNEMTVKLKKLEKSRMESLAENMDKIKELEEEVEKLKSSRVLHSVSSSDIPSPRPSSVTSPIKKEVFSPIPQFKDVTSPTESLSRSSIDSHAPKTAAATTTPTTTSSESSTPVPDSSSKVGRVRRVSKELSTEKPPSVPTSSSRKVGKLLRESSIDRFENITKDSGSSSSSSKKKTKSVSSPSPTHTFAKVSATRAMFEQKIDQTKTSQAKHTTKPSENEPQPRRSSMSVTTSNSKNSTVTLHYKSNSYDSSANPTSVLSLSKPPATRIENVPEVASVPVDKSKSVPPTSIRSMSNGATTMDNEAKNKINNKHKQQQEKVVAVAIAPVHERSTPTTKTSEKVGTTTSSKSTVSKITVTSTASPSTSPMLTNRKETSLKLPQQGPSPTSEMIVRTSNSPSLVIRKSPSPTPQTRVLHSQQSSPAKMTSVTLKNSSSTDQPSAAADTKTVHSAVTKSLTQIKIHSPVNSWKKNEKQTIVVTTNSTTSPSNSTVTSPTNGSVPKPVSVLDNKLGSKATKVGSLQNIQSYVNSKDDSSIPSVSKVEVSTSSTSSTSSSTSSSSGIRRGPTHKAMQRRERKDRPKTMYARAETTNLMNLISKFQQEEKEKVKTSEPSPSSSSSLSSSSSPSFLSSPKMNGSSTSPTFNSVSHTVTSSTAAIRSPKPGSKSRQRPATMYADDISSTSTNLNTPDFSTSFSKPLPRDRKLVRAQTVGFGLGNNRMSKKAMLLKWCQLNTEKYENVSITNFAESFSNGLAFCALIHHFLPDQVPFGTLTPSNREKNFKIAFEAAEGVGIPSLLDVEDMVSLPVPDWMSVMTYVSFIYNKFGQQENQQSQQQQQHLSMV